MLKYEDNAVARLNGNNLQPLSGVTVTVTDNATALPASLYSDNGVTLITAPIVTNDDGYFSFYAPDGLYTLTFTSPRIAPITRQIALEDPRDNPYASKAELAAGTGSALITFTQAGSGATQRTVQDKARDIVSVKDFGAKGDGVNDDYGAINNALSAANTIFFPPGTYMTSAGSAGKPSHVITGKCIIGFSREVSIIKATGLNEGRTLFVNDKTDVNAPGVWGSGKDFRIENLWIRGNWDATSGLSSVTEGSVTAPVGILKSNYNPDTQTALIKGVSAAYCFIVNSYIDNAFEHGIIFYRLGYSEISGNIIARCRGSGLWLTADSASSAITSTTVERNQIVANRGGYGGLFAKYLYGVAIQENRPFEDNTWGAWIGEGADVALGGNYFEINPFGDAYIDPTIWGLNLIPCNYWTIPPVLPSGVSARGFFGHDRKIGLRHLPAPGLGETDNRLGPVRYSCDSNSIGVNRAPASSGTGLSFPATQDPSSDPDTLDDYKERDVVLTDLSGAGLSFTGSVKMDKVGRGITVYGQLTFPTTSSAASISIGGIPLVGSTGAVGNIGDNAGLGPSIVLAAAGATSFSIYPAGSFTNRTNANLSGKVVYFNFTYIAG